VVVKPTVAMLQLPATVIVLVMVAVAVAAKAPAALRIGAGRFARTVTPQCLASD